MATTVTVKGQVTLPKAVRDAAGIKPGDRVEVRLAPSGHGVVVEPVGPRPTVEAIRKRIEDAVKDLHRRGIRPSMSADEIMALTRSEI